MRPSYNHPVGWQQDGRRKGQEIGQVFAVLLDRRLLGGRVFTRLGVRSRTEPARLIVNG
jgi:hypothetical protein